MNICMADYTRLRSAGAFEVKATYDLHTYARGALHAVGDCAVCRP